jgi:hypothetical protein
MLVTIDMGLRFVMGFIGHLKLVTTGNYNCFIDLHTLQVTTLQHTQSLLCLHQSLPGNGSEPCRFLSFRTRVLTGWRLACISSWPLTHGLSLCNLGMDCIENTVSSSSLIVAGVLASHCVALARLFVEPFPCNGQCLGSHVTVFYVILLCICKSS